MKNQQRKRIILASVLKPVDDTRMFEKMAISLADSGAYEVTIIGHPSVQKRDYPNIHFIALKNFKRLSLGRLLAPLQVLKETLQVKPEALIINTHELLIVAILNRILFGAKICYDIQENYFRNLLHTSAFPPILKTLLAYWVRLKEKLLVPFFHWSFLAEKGYEKEMHFFGKKYTVIENKVVVPKAFSRKPKDDSFTTLLFSGTLAESTGVFQAIDLAKKLHGEEVKIRLKIIGYCAQPATQQKIQGVIKGCSYIDLIGGAYLVPHAQILKEIEAADFGIIYYPPSAHTENAMPTKLYEYAGYRLPILLQNHTPWVAFCSPFQGAIPIDFEHVEPAGILQKMNSSSLYTTPPKNVTWENESEKLLLAIASLLH
jgi:glycosyltransferase involved in cell wall biosynthesis